MRCRNKNKLKEKFKRKVKATTNTSRKNLFFVKKRNVVKKIFRVKNDKLQKAQLCTGPERKNRHVQNQH